MDKKSFFLFMILLLSSLLFVSCTDIEGINPFYVKASDGVKLSANYFPPSYDSAKGILLIHMLGGSKGDWDSLVPHLTAEGFHILAVDLRGHGLSDLDWNEFSDNDFLRSILDVTAGLDYLSNKGVKRFGIIGAGIGANIALKQASQDVIVNSVVLLSPSVDYSGVNILANIDSFDRNLFIISSLNDIQSADDSLILYERSSADKKILFVNSSAHGTDMVGNVNLRSELIDWLDLNI